MIVLNIFIHFISIRTNHFRVIRIRIQYDTKKKKNCSDVWLTYRIYLPIIENLLYKCAMKYHSEKKLLFHAESGS